MVGKIAILERQFLESGIHVACLQEGRAKLEVVKSGTHFTMFVAAATPAGQNGCQTWVSKEMRIKVQEFRPVSERIIAVAGDSAVHASRLIIVSAHAPTEDSSSDNKDLF